MKPSAKALGKRKVVDAETDPSHPRDPYIRQLGTQTRHPHYSMLCHARTSSFLLSLSQSIRTPPSQFSLVPSVVVTHMELSFLRCPYTPPPPRRLTNVKLANTFHPQINPTTSSLAASSSLLAKSSSKITSSSSVPKQVQTLPLPPTSLTNPFTVIVVLTMIKASPYGKPAPCPPLPSPYARPTNVIPVRSLHSSWVIHRSPQDGITCQQYKSC
jgi:hypothetical protein